MPHVTMPPSEAVYRNLNNAFAVLVNQGLSLEEADTALREGFASFYASHALETAHPRREVARLVEAVERHLNNQGLSAAVRLPARRIFRRLFDWRPAA